MIRSLYVQESRYAVWLHLLTHDVISVRFPCLQDIFWLTETQFLWFPSGIIRGALAGMGITANVQGETSGLPGATFQIKTAGSRP